MKRLVYALMVTCSVALFSFKPKAKGAYTSESKNRHPVTQGYWMKTDTLDRKDSLFLLKAASSGRMEVELGALAQEKSSDARVRNFGAMMVRDHTKANRDLMALAAEKGLILTDTLLPKHRAHIDHLRTLNGKAFNKAYIRMMNEAHKDDLEEYTDIAEDSEDAGVKAFASKTLPVLRTHKEAVDALKIFLED